MRHLLVSRQIKPIYELAFPRLKEHAEWEEQIVRSTASTDILTSEGEKSSKLKWDFYSPTVNIFDWAYSVQKNCFKRYLNIQLQFNFIHSITLHNILNTW